jgi:hypothetical protein
MTDYAATVFGRATLVAVSSQRLGASSVDDAELRQRERDLEDVLDVRRAEYEQQVELSTKLISKLATLEGKLRDKDEEIKANWEHLKRLEAEVKRLKKLAPKEAK